MLWNLVWRWLLLQKSSQLWTLLHWTNSYKHSKLSDWIHVCFSVWISSSVQPTRNFHGRRFGAYRNAVQVLCIRLLCPWNLKRQCIGIKSWLRILCLKFQRWINSQTKILITGAIIIVYNNNTFQFWFWFVIEIFNFDLFKLRCTHLNVCAAV